MIFLKLSEVKKILNAEVVCGKEMLDREVSSAFGCDLMSDVLAHARDQSMLISGLNNVQVIRTAEMMDMHCIIFVRGKKPEDAVVELAKEKKMVILRTELTMYTSCGLLYQAGLRTKDDEEMIKSALKSDI